MIRKVLALCAVAVLLRPTPSAAVGECAFFFRAFPEAPNFLLPGDRVRLNIDVTAMAVPGFELSLHRIRLDLDCSVDSPLGAFCADDGPVVAYAGDHTITTDCPVRFSSDHPGGTAPNQVVFAPTPPVILGGFGFPTCRLSFDVEVLAAGSSDSTPGKVEQVVSAVAGDTSCGLGAGPAESAATAFQLCPLCDAGDACSVCNQETGICDAIFCADDGDPCTIESCEGPTATCRSRPVSCCTAGGCDPTTGLCTGALTGLCDDGDACTTETCEAASGRCERMAAVGCDDGNVCTTDACNPLTGQCEVTGARSCEDANPCTDDFCDPTRACLHVDNTGPCQAPDVCTLVACRLGDCVETGEIDCDDRNSCTRDACHPADGCVSVPDDTARCTDANACTLGERCVAGHCVGGTARGCEDGNPCTDDFCDPLVGCVHDSVSRQGASCEDGAACTRDDRCERGFCEGARADGDLDDDGYDDDVEVRFGCRADDPSEIPPQAARFAGKPREGAGEGLLTYAAPAAAEVEVRTDPACSSAGRCGAGGFCAAGRIADPCRADADCDQAAGVCRMVVNSAAVRVAITGVDGVGAAANGCARKLDLPVGAHGRRIKLRAAGSVGGRRRHEADRFVLRSPG
jgi:hypothetical protein